MKNIQRLLILSAAIAVVAIVTFALIPLITDPWSFALGSVMSLVLAAIIVIVLHLRNASTVERSRIILAAVILVLAGLSFGFAIYTINGIATDHKMREENRDRLENAQIEAARLSSQVDLVSGLIEQVQSELSTNQERQLSDITIDRIEALSHTLKPRFLIDSDTATAVELSPERGQLLLMLSTMSIDTASLQRIFLRTSFEGADLGSADLRNIFLKGARLRGANFRDAKLDGANLTEADLRSAIFWGAILNGANCDGADMRRADLRWAELNRATLRNADLSSAQLASAKLRNADLSGSVIQWAFLQNAFLDNAIMVKTDFSGSSLEKAHLSGVDLSGADLRRAGMSYSDLKDARLDSVVVWDADWFEILSSQRVQGADELTQNYEVVGDTTRQSYFVIYPINN